MKVASVKESQAVIYNILRQAKQNNRLSHAYLFYGEKGTGKKEMAIALEETVDAMIAAVKEELAK